MTDAPSSTVATTTAARRHQVADRACAAVHLQTQGHEDVRFQCGTLILAGDVAEIIAIADECLEPWKDTGISESEVRELYEPRITTKETTS
jgi:hypothetical protein